MRWGPWIALTVVLAGCYSSKATEQPPPARAAKAPCPQATLTTPEVWRHRISSSATATLLGQPHHAATDPVVNPGAGAVVAGKFAYGSTSKDLEDEDVTLLVQTAPCRAWAPVATARTDSNGEARFTVPGQVIDRSGAYPFQLVVHGDRSRAYGTIFVVAPGTRAVVFDIDGTLTTSDAQLARQIALGDDPAMRTGADAVARAYADGGYFPIYITGRPYFLRETSRDWLRRRGFPRGALITTENLRQASPSRSGVGAFKLSRLKGLIDDAGVSIEYAYGNASTDVCAYAEAGIAPRTTYIVGKHAGEACGAGSATQPLDDYQEHLQALPIH